MGNVGMVGAEIIQIHYVWGSPFAVKTRRDRFAHGPSILHSPEYSGSIGIDMI